MEAVNIRQPSCQDQRLARVFRLKYEDASPTAMIGAATNHFEVAIATSVMLFGLLSGAALATVVGVLMEVGAVDASQGMP